ncbi:ester cyclase [Sinorhizobium medicae]|nr:ester cyclase [Sinorhizobium medicae]
MTHYHYKDGKIVDEWNVYDELSLLVQVKLAEMARQSGSANAEAHGAS